MKHLEALGPAFDTSTVLNLLATAPVRKQDGTFTSRGALLSEILEPDADGASCVAAWQELVRSGMAVVDHRPVPASGSRVRLDINVRHPAIRQDVRRFAEEWLELLLTVPGAKMVPGTITRALQIPAAPFLQEWEYARLRAQQPEPQEAALPAISPGP